MNSFGVELAICDQDRRGFVFASSLFTVINGHVAESCGFIPGDGTLGSILVVAQLESQYLLIFGQPDDELEVAG